MRCRGKFNTQCLLHSLTNHS